MFDNNKLGEIRPNQLITTFGPGAIVDAVKDSVTILDLNYWKEKGTLIEELAQPIHTKRGIPNGHRCKTQAFIPYPNTEGTYGRGPLPDYSSTLRHSEG